MAANRKIAVVNHDPVFLRLVQRLLQSDDYDVILCPHGTAAHDLIASAQPAAVMIDTWLEDREGGWQLMQTLRLDDATRSIPILICSSDPDEIERRAGQLESMPRIMILAKPFDPEVLLARLDTLINGTV